jgi:hypothetical protein
MNLTIVDAKGSPSMLCWSKQSRSLRSGICIIAKLIELSLEL